MQQAEQQHRTLLSHLLPAVQNLQDAKQQLIALDAIAAEAFGPPSDAPLEVRLCQCLRWFACTSH